MQKKDKILFSIIVPVYNTEKYINKCLDSIVNAIDDDCEVIIINDGSTDKSDNIIKNYIKKIPNDLKERFIYVKKENKGLADTKNVGIAKSRGKYISVVDSDDWITENFYTDARKYTNEDYDIIIYDLYVKYENQTKENIDYIARAYRDDVDGNLIDKVINGAMQGSSCNKIIKKDLYQYEFPVGKEYEDVAVTPFIMIDAKKIKYIPHPNYNYLQRKRSIVASNTFDSAFYKICRNISDVLDKNKDYNKYIPIINTFFIYRTIDMLTLSLKKSRRNFINNLKLFYEENKTVIEYIINNNLIEKSSESLTIRQSKVLKEIYVNLYNKKYSKIKTVLTLRRILNWFREIARALKHLIKALLGGHYE